MKLWLLRPVETLSYETDPWRPWYDKAFGFVVRAATEADARALAMTEAGDEVNDWRDGFRVNLKRGVWMDPAFSTCVELLPEGDAAVIIRDFARA